MTARPHALVAEGIGEYHLVSALFVRLLALIYLIAFYSLSIQIIGLAGEQGILPLQALLDSLLADLGWSAFFQFPTLFWLSHSDLALQAVAWAGCGFSILLFFNVKPRLQLVLLFVCYLSLTKAGQTFMHFQWDVLLLEAGFLAIFLRPDSRLMIFLMRWLLFRLRFMSGISKLAMQDPAWLGMTALVYYFETQPLPHVGAWYFHNLPQILLIATTVLVLIIEILLPFMMFMRRRYRFFAAWVTLGLQLLILLSSNHNWFNLLSIILILFLFDDHALRRVTPQAVQNWLMPGAAGTKLNPISPMRHRAHQLMVLLLVTAGVLSIWRLAVPVYWPAKLDAPLATLARWHVLNTYHVFPTMTTRQIELKIEGSYDGRNWREYTFRYRPNQLEQRPEIVLPHHPRLDWMMWFVPLHPRFFDWFDEFLTALLENRSAVLSLLANNPFPDKPPNMLRVRAWQYEFTTPAERARTGHWWKRRDLGIFRPFPGKYKIPQK